MMRTEARRQEERKRAAVYAYRHATVLLNLAGDNEEAQESIQLALGLLERAWEHIDRGTTLLELAQKAVI